MPCRREIASRYVASARSRCTSGRHGRAAIPKRARPWPCPASTCLISSRAKTCASGSTTVRTDPSGIERQVVPGTTPSFPTTLDLEPWSAGPFQFEMALPGSKSLTLRDCAIAALADGVSTIRYPGECDDYWRMKDCLRRLGISVDDSSEGSVRISGQGGQFKDGAIELDTGQSAVSTRLLLAMASLRPGATLIDGHISMR